MPRSSTTGCSTSARLPQLPPHMRSRRMWGPPLLIVVCGFASASSIGCVKSALSTAPADKATLRIGVARIGSESTLTGLRPIAQNTSTEALARIAEDGRPEPWLAEGWSISPNGLNMDVRLRPGVKFHDGSPVTAATVVKVLDTALPKLMGPAFEDVDHIAATGEKEIDIGFRRPSPFLREILEVRILQPDHPDTGTGPFLLAAASSFSEFHANRDYYLGSPGVDRIFLTNYPSVRAAWADMLRDRVDMLYEVNPDALPLMQNAKNVSLFSFARPYQYMVVLNVRSPKLRDAGVRRALNLAIDRKALVRDAFDGHAQPSSGPISARHWLFRDDFPRLTFDPSAAARLLSPGKGRSFSAPLRFACLVPPDYERVALVVKRQLEAVGVVMDLREASSDEAVQALGKPTFEAVILDAIQGPSLFRMYQWWHSGGSLNPGAMGSPAIDNALDTIRNARSDDDYRNAAAAFQRVAINEPPAIFLAWGERARVVSTRFHVPADPGRDILTTLRLWRPVAGERLASRN